MDEPRWRRSLKMQNPQLTQALDMGLVAGVVPGRAHGQKRGAAAARFMRPEDQVDGVADDATARRGWRLRE